MVAKIISRIILTIFIIIIISFNVLSIHGNDSETSVFKAEHGYSGYNNLSGEDTKTSLDLTVSNEIIGKGKSNDSKTEIYLGYHHAVNIDYYPEIARFITFSSSLQNPLSDTSYIQSGDNLRVNATIIDEWIKETWIKIWKGTTVYINENLDKSGRIRYFKEILTDPSWIGEVNISINATDKENKKTDKKMKIIVDDLNMIDVEFFNQIIPINNLDYITGQMTSYYLYLPEKTFDVYIDNIYQKTITINPDNTFNFTITAPATPGNYSIILNSTIYNLYVEYDSWIYVGNEPIQNQDFDPEPAYTTNNITSSWNRDTLYEPYVNITYFEWYVNSNFQFGNKTLLQSFNSTITKDRYNKHDMVTLKLFTFDGKFNRTEQNYTIEIQNTIPIITFMSMQDRESDDIFNCNVDSFDPDYDIDKIWYRFEINETVVQEWSTSQYLDCYGQSLCLPGKEVICYAKADDLEANSSIKNTSAFIEVPEFLTIESIDYSIATQENSTLSTNVLLYLELLDSATTCQYSNDDIDYSLWEDCSITKTWQLSEGYGLKTVYVRINHTAESGGKIYTISDNIYYSQTGDIPKSFEVFDQGDYTKDNSSLYFEWTDASDKQTDIYDLNITYKVRLEDTSDDVYLTSWIDNGNKRSITFTNYSLIENHTYVLGVDAINNNSASMFSQSDGITLDMTKPVLESINLIGNENWTNSKDVQFYINATDEVSGIKGYSLLFNNLETSTPDNTIDETKNPITIKDNLEGYYYLHIKVYDNAGNYVNASYGPIGIDYTKPSIPLIDNNDQRVENLSYHVSWQESIDLFSGLDFYSLYLFDSDNNLLESINLSKEKTSHEFIGLADDDYFVALYAYDKAMNNASEFEGSFDKLKILSAIPNGTDTIVSKDAIIKVITNNKAICSQDATNSDFIYTNSTYHETRLSLEDGLRKVKILCRDVSGNIVTQEISFRVEKDVTVSSIDIYPEDSYYENNIMKINFTVNNNIASIPSKDFDVYIEDIKINISDYSIIDMNRGDYILEINGIEKGNKELKISVYDVDGTTILDVIALTMTLSFSSNDTINQDSNLAYTSEDDNNVGIGTSSNKPSITSTSDKMFVDSTTDSISYLFMTGNKINSKVSNLLLKNIDFDTKIKGFGTVVGNVFNLRQVLDYKNIFIIGDIDALRGYQKIILINEGLDEDNRTVIRIEKI